MNRDPLLEPASRFLSRLLRKDNMRVHLIGSSLTEEYNRKPKTITQSLKRHSRLFSAAADIGRVCAERGHTLMVGSAFELTVDHHAVNYGFIPVVASQPTRDFYLEVWRPNDDKLPFSEHLKVHKNLKIEYHVRRPGIPG